MSRHDYEFERANAYCYPNSSVLRNKFDIRDRKTLDTAEREFTSARITYIKDHPIKGKLDFKHLRAIHRYLFCDIYDWAGELRTVNIAKGNQFCNYLHLETYADGIFLKLKAERFLLKAPVNAFSERLAHYFSEINILHPFREGNGRTQRVFIEYLAQAAGYHVSFADVTDREMIEASALAFALEYGMMVEMLSRITAPIAPEEQMAFRIKIGLSRL